MKVKIDPDRCVGQGMCFMTCPQVFQLNDEDGHGYVLQEDVPPGLEENVLQAVRGCPEQAISTS